MLPVLAIVGELLQSVRVDALDLLPHRTLGDLGVLVLGERHCAVRFSSHGG